LQQTGSPAGGFIHFAGAVPTTANNLASTVLKGGNTLAGITLGVNTVTFAAGMPGVYKVDLILYATTVAQPTPGGWAGSAGATNAPNLILNDSSNGAASNASSVATTSFAMVTNFVTISPTGGLITLTPTAIAGAQGVDLIIMSVPSSALSSVKNVESDRAEIDELRDEVREMREWFRSNARLLESHHSASSSDGRVRILATTGSSSVPAPTETMSEPDTPDESKESDLNKSVHISRSMASRLSQALRLQ